MAENAPKICRERGSRTGLTKERCPIEIKRTPGELLIRGLCALLALFTLFLLTLSLVFTFGGDAPNLFGKNIYIVKTDAIEALKPGSALFTTKISPDEIIEGDIVVFKSAENLAGIAEIVSIRFSDNVFGFTAVSERGVDLTLTQSQIVGKATKYSNFFGGLISFAKSPAGVMVIAVIPCLIILIYEGSKYIFMTLRKNDEITPVKKQDEVPTYIPRQKISAAMNAYTKAEGFASEPLREPESEPEDYPLFTPPYGKPKPKPAAPAPAPAPALPLSQKKLNRAIAEVNARKTAFPFDSDENKSVESTAEISEISEIAKIPAVSEKSESLKSYVPKKKPESRSGRQFAQTSSMPSLDKLLRDDDGENEGAGYSIEDILYSYDRNK